MTAKALGITPKSSVELADVFRLHAKRYCETHTLTSHQHKVIHAIQNCRTSMLGGHVDRCDECDELSCSYNSCRNRHCPKCESFKAFRWLESKQEELLPVPYFHVVFTLPHELNNLVLYNKRILYHLLFQSAWEAINKLGSDPKRLNGKMGMLSLLHTWGQNLLQHNHVHCIVPGGALKASGKWQSTKKYLFPVKVLSQIFRGTFVSKLRMLYDSGKLTIPTFDNALLHPDQFDALLNTLMKKDWVVYAKKPFAGPRQLLNYLGRYTHKIAISNHRIISCDNKSVTFKWRDYADNNKEKIMTLDANEFIRRYLSHIVPSGFMRIRVFGFLANACKAKMIVAIQRTLRFKPKKADKNQNVVTAMLLLTGKDITVCPTCNSGKLQRVYEIPSLFGGIVNDTS